jgi:hypothetical protein
MRRILACAVAILATPALSSAALILSDDFESYADNAALGAVWTLSASPVPNMTALDTANGNPGQSMNFLGAGAGVVAGSGNHAIRNFTGVYPAANQTLIWEADIYDDGAAGKRVSAGLRTGTGANIIEMGMYNDAATANGYAIRTVLFGPGSNGLWLPFTGMVDDLGAPINNSPVVGWHSYRADITNSNVTFTLDLNSDGNVNGTITVPIFQNGTNLFNSVRLGGPSGLSSGTAAAPRPAKFDNISLTLIPEPTTALLAALGLAAAGFRRR